MELTYRSPVTFREMSESEMLSVCGGIDWGSIANFATSAAIISAALPIPGAQAVTIVCGAFAAGYYLGHGLTH